MKNKLLQLLRTNPATAGRDEEFYDNLTDDIQAVIIRALLPKEVLDDVVLPMSTFLN